MSGYFDACLRALTRAGNVDLFLAHSVEAVDAPFADEQFAWLQDREVWESQPQLKLLRRKLKTFGPDVILVSSWHIGAYRRLVKEWHGGALRVLCMDNQWRGTPKQWLGRATHPLYLKPYFDVAFVPGDRQAQFAKYLGFKGTRILRGLYCCDTKAFQRPQDASWGEGFLYVGRLVPDKGIDILAEAYSLYRAQTDNPWPLRVAGTGPLAKTLTGMAGVELLGFVQPGDLPKMMWESCALVLPSRFEPWGVVVHEATTAGLPVLCSEEVGAAVHLLQDGYNGFLFPPGNATALATRLLATSRLSDEGLSAMRLASITIASQLTTERWAEYLLAATADATFERA